jgi:hypothetical protein
MDFYWHDTMYVVPLYRVVAVGSLLLGLLVAAVALIVWLIVWIFGRALHRR